MRRPFRARPNTLPPRDAVRLPVLRKDFMLEAYQVAEARSWGADAILVILAMVDDGVARTLMDAAAKFGMDALVEVHDQGELDRALELGAGLIGVNNRNLKTFVTDLGVTLKLAHHAPKSVHLVAESGLSAPADLKRLAGAHVTSVLIGESLMRQGCRSRDPPSSGRRFSPMSRHQWARDLRAEAFVIFRAGLSRPERLDAARAIGLTPLPDRTGSTAGPHSHPGGVRRQ